MNGEVDKCHLVPLTRENLSDLIELAKDPYFGMPRSRRWFERLYFNPAVSKDVENGVRGFLVERACGGYVGMLTFAPCHVYLGQQRKIAYWGAMLGVKKKYWETLFDLFKALESDHPNSFAFGNCGANNASIKVAVACRGDKTGPEEGHYSYNRMTFLATWHEFITFYLLFNRIAIRIAKSWPGFPFRDFVCDLSWRILRCVEMLKGKFFSRSPYPDCPNVVVETAIAEDKFKEFWEKYLSRNVGLASSRDPQILKHYFSDSLNAGTVLLFSHYSEDGNLDGYVLVRRYGASFRRASPIYRYKIVDAIAIDDDVSVLSKLVRSVVNHAHKRGIGVVQYIGANPKLTEWLQPFLDKKIDLGHHTFTYYCPPCESGIRDALVNRSGWFFGPYDGERCLGHGGFVDI